MCDMGSDIEFVFQVPGQLIRCIYAAMLSAGATEVYGQVAEPPLQVVFYGQVHDAINVLQETMHLGLME